MRNDNESNLQQINTETNYFVIYPLRYLDYFNHRQCTLIGVLNSLSNKYGFAYASNARIASILRTSRKSLERDLITLESQGVITREIVRDKDGQVLMRKIYINNGQFGEHPPRLHVDNPPPQNGGQGTRQDVGDNSIEEIEIPIKKGIGYTAEFELIWEKYKKRGVKARAFKAWKKLNGSQRKQAHTHIGAYVAHYEEKGKIKYMPYLSKWLNEHTWEAMPVDEDEQFATIDWG